MKTKTVLATVCLVALISAAGFFYFQNSRKDAELGRLRQEIAQTQKTLADFEASKTSQAAAESQELVRLRKDNEDLLRLRNEVRQLRNEKQQLEKQLQTAQNETQRAQGQIQAVQTQAAQSQAQLAQAQAQASKQGTQAQTLTPEQQEAFRKRYGLAPATDEQSKANACISNLRQIDGAKQQWALENRKTATTLPGVQDIARYLPNNVMPACPGGGAYTINTVSALPVCSIPTHALR